MSGTGEPQAFAQALAGCLDRAAREHSSVAVLLIDCGLVSRIDAACGYQIGDAVRARAMALVQAELLRAGDVLGQLGRDEIACALVGLDPAVALLAAEKALRVLGAGFWIGDDEVFASPAIGLAEFPEQGDSPERLLERARRACNEARSMPARIAAYAEPFPNTALNSLLHESRLRTAVSSDAFDVVFQPQYDLRLGQVMGAVAHLREADGTLVSWDEAFAAAEAAGAVQGLLSAVLNRALRNVSEFRYSGGLDLRLGVGLPARALLHSELPDVVQRALGTWSLRAGRLNLQISDTVFLGAEPAARETLLRLKAVGVRLAIDDPEVGLSSLFWLSALPFQELRIDVSRLDPAAAPKSEQILRAVVDLGRQLRLEVAAVHPIDEATSARVKELGCDSLVGDWKRPPLDAAAFIERYGYTDR